MVALLTAPFKTIEKYYQDLHRFGLKLSEAALTFQQMVQSGKFPERGTSFSYDRGNPRDILNRSIDITRQFEFLVAVTGAFSSGKSSLLNVLLARPDLLPASAIPMTAVCTVVRHARDPRVQVRFVTLEECFDRVRTCLERPFKKPFERLDQLSEAMERPENFLVEPADRESLRRFARIMSSYDRIVNRPVTFEERHRFIAGGGVVAVHNDRGNRHRYFLPTPAQEKEYLEAGGDPELWVTRELLAFIRDVTLWVDSPLLENNIVFLDLPGLNCREDYHRRAIQEYCNMADCIVVTAFQAGNQADEAVIQNFKRLSSNFREKMFFVFNRVDQFQTEPEELTRSFDYLTRDCIGQDFPRDRSFLTSAYLSREQMRGTQKFQEEFQAFAKAFRGFQSNINGLDNLIAHATSSTDPGGVNHFRDRLQAFLKKEAYATKMAEVLDNYDQVLSSMRSAASPRYEDALRIDPRDLALGALFDYFQRIEQVGKTALCGFRYDYLRGSENGSSSLSQDLKGALEKSHQEVQRRIVGYFNRPIPIAPPREDPVREFDLCRIADDASNELRREFQEVISSTVADCVRHRFYEYLNRHNFREHVKNLLHGAADWTERLERILQSFEFMLRHSVLCKIRSRFYFMPGGRDLKRLEQRVRISDMKAFLVKIFSEFYPSWIYQNIYGEIQNGLWLSFFLDAEELEAKVGEYFDGCRGILTTSAVLKNARIPEEFSQGPGGLYEVAGICKQIEEMIQEKEELKSRNNWVSSAVPE